MLFNSFDFLIFFLVVFFFCLLLQCSGIEKVWKIKIRNALLLLASYSFYAFFNWKFLFLLLAATIVNYVSALKIESVGSKKRDSLLWLWIAALVSISVLGYFKYADFFIDSVNKAMFMLGIAPQLHLMKILLPVGISFFTFQALSYTLDVYNGKMKARKNFIDIALYVSFFPTILSGPIERGRNLIPQMERESQVSVDNLLAALKLFLWGLFKKVVIADRLAEYINVVYSRDPESFSSLTLLLTIVLYSFQIYADFSGYSDMAIGIGKSLGFDLMANFHFPYFSTSIKTFWKRWHISLTSWFTEYVYIPLGGNRVARNRFIINILVVFLLSGFWHGASWTFIIWGALHAVYYLIEFSINKLTVKKTNPREMTQKKPWMLSFISCVLVFALVTIAWVFFRMENFEKSINLLSHLFSGTHTLFWGSSAFSTILSLLLLSVFIVMEWIKFRQVKMSLPVNAVAYAVILSMIVLFGSSSESFVYFQF